MISKISTSSPFLVLPRPFLLVAVFERGGQALSPPEGQDGVLGRATLRARATLRGAEVPLHAGEGRPRHRSQPLGDAGERSERTNIKH